MGAPLWEPLCGNPSQGGTPHKHCESQRTRVLHLPPPRGGGENVYNDLGVW